MILPSLSVLYGAAPVPYSEALDGPECCQDGRRGSRSWEFAEELESLLSLLGP